jgi:hypothetical protein
MREVAANYVHLECSKACRGCNDKAGLRPGLAVVGRG